MQPLALIVENDSGIQRLLSVLLNRLGYEVDAIADGSEALLLLEQIRYDLTLVDLFLPTRSGEDILEWIAANRPGDLARAVMLSSALPSVMDRIQAQFPTVRVFHKPFELADIVAAAEEAMRDRESREITAAQQFARRSVKAGAKAGIIVRNRGENLSLVHAFGYPPGVMEGWFPLSAAAPYPLTMCVREQHPFWVASPRIAARDFPTLTATWQQAGSQAVASVPVVRSGVVIGAAGWTFREPQRFDAGEQRALTAIAAEAASLIEAA
jgi:CheY-like chemotaxis protein